jgi:integrase
MNGWINEARSRPPDRWRLILDLGSKVGGKGRRQKWLTFRGTHREAEKKLRELLGDDARGEFIEPTKLTVGEWLDRWVENSVQPRLNARTYRKYKGIIRLHLKPRLGAIRVQALRASDVERYRMEIGVSSRTGQIHQVVLGAAMKSAVRDGIVRSNVVSLATVRPPHKRVRVSVAWTSEEAAAVINAARQRSSQIAALIALALDSGARKAEIQGLQWSAVDLDAGTLRIERQFLRGARKDVVEFGPTKTGKMRSLNLSAETVVLLREHKRTQAELKLANRPYYVDHGLTFAQAHEDLHSHSARLGAPLVEHHLDRVLERLIAATGVRRTMFHGLRHTSATLLLAAGVQPHVVQQRLGHASIGTTLNLYAHVLPAQQADAASRLAALLYGSGPS